MSRSLAALATFAALAGVTASCTSGTNPSGAGTTASGGAVSSVAPSAGQTAAGTISVGTTTGDLGTFLVDGKGRTVYLFEADKPNVSACSGPCPDAWPPMTGTPQAGAGVTSSHLGTFVRQDGKSQVTYYGHPLYYFIKDTAAGDTHGQGITAFGANWYVLDANGNKIDKS